MDYGIAGRRFLQTSALQLTGMQAIEKKRTQLGGPPNDGGPLSLRADGVAASGRVLLLTERDVPAWLNVTSRGENVKALA